MGINKNNKRRFIFERINAAGKVTRADPRAFEESNFPIELSEKDKF